MQRLLRVNWAGRGWWRRRSLLALLLTTLSVSAVAQRLPVLRQIDLPHPYYYREMYLPQLTSGPSSLAWSPDSRELVYSMAGSLWRQTLGTTLARQLTADGVASVSDDDIDGAKLVVCSREGGFEVVVFSDVAGHHRNAGFGWIKGIL